jgi:signal transduction histidine kinase
VPDNLIGDEVRLRQIVTNLVVNSIKFTEVGGVSLRMASEGRPGALHLTVTDTGIRIPENRQAQIFEAFTRADGSTTRTHGGTGLGLSIASRLADMMGGAI